jgi:hypothetical protein
VEQYADTENLKMIDRAQILLNHQEESREDRAQRREYDKHKKHGAAMQFAQEEGLMEILKANAKSTKVISKFSKDLLESEFQSHLRNSYSKQIGGAIDQIIGDAQIDLDKVFPVLDELVENENGEDIGEMQSIEVNFDVPLTRSAMAKSIPAKATITFQRPPNLKRTFGTQVYSFNETDALKVDEGNKIKYAGGLSETIDHTEKDLSETRKKLEALIESSTGMIRAGRKTQLVDAAIGEHRRSEVLQKLGETSVARGAALQLPSLRGRGRGTRLHQSNLNAHSLNMLRESANSFNSISLAN